MLSIGFALRHLPDLRAAFEEWRRVLKPGGTILILEIAPPSSRAAFAMLRLSRLGSIRRHAASR